VPASLVRESRERNRPVARVAAETASALIGVALVVSALAATQERLDRHFLPSFLLPRRLYMQLETVVRLGMAVAGVSLAIVVRSAVGRFVARAPARALHIVIAAALAIAASEPVLRRVHVQYAEWLLSGEEPLRRPDPYLGWTLVPARTGRSVVGGRTVEYAIDANGYRVRNADHPIDRERPAILFTGESVMFGEGLTWEESVPAQVEAMLHIPSANLAVHGFGSDQSYLRLRMELPRFREPVAVVSLFMTALFGRNLDRERPHLGPGLVWLPPAHAWRLRSLTTLLVPYRSDAVIENGIAVTREVLGATVDLARSRRATPLILVPQFGEEDPAARTLRRRIVDDAGVPYLLVEFDSTWRLPWDRHPDARAAHSIADAIAARLKPRATS
jgi:hypothetical protein